ncbi:hypothetical protein B0O99DRAFT_208169 [Bisporella sp. PMI_857]|nr:hypothetical protein B0O99DRAFT_208169 [Bisporella sp. PMI_857]
MPPLLPIRVLQPSSDFLFITQTGLEQEHGIQTKIRKHVMKEIGRSRRKTENYQKDNQIHVELEVPEDFTRQETRPEPNVKDLVRKSKSNEQILDAINELPISSVAGSFLLKGASGPLQVIPSKALAFLQLSRAAKDTELPRVERLWTGRMDPFIRYPIKMNQRTLQLMDHIFDDRYGNTPPFRNVWFPVGLIDAGGFHQLLSNASLNMAALRARGHEPETYESLIHHHQAVAIVAQKLTDPILATSDGILGAIVGFACYAHVHLDLKSWRMHMDAAKVIVIKRGGMEKLAPLLQMIIFWVDVGGSATADQKPLFPPPADIITSTLYAAILESPLSHKISKSWVEAYPDHVSIIDIMNDMRSYSYCLSQEVERTRGGIYREDALASTLLPLLHHLLSLSVNGASPVQQRLNIIRLSCILFLAGIRRLFAIMGVFCKLQVSKLKDYLKLQPGDWGSLEPLKAWCLAMGAMEAIGVTREWYMDELEASRARLGINTWEEMLEKFRGILWYEPTHTRTFRDICDGIDKSESW